MSSHPIDRCLCCDGSGLRTALDLGEQPPANRYAVSSGEVVPTHPLALNVCPRCWHAQLSYCVDRRELFDRYAYVSGTSKTLGRFFEWFAGRLAKVVGRGGRVLELAANDGSLIRAMQAAGLECQGVDPAANIVETARAEGLPIVCGYWPQAGEQLEGGFDAIVCMNVVAHVDDPFAFLRECARKLNPGGMVFVQPSQARMFENGEFDTIYHEHLSFFNTRSIGELARRAGLRLVDAFLVGVHGDSPVYVLQHAEEPEPRLVRDAFAEGEFAIAEALTELERRTRLFEWTTYERFRDRAHAVIEHVVATVRRHQAEGFGIVFVGAAAKAMTLINAAALKPAYFFDENPMKIGLHAPGCGTRIDPLEAAAMLETPALFVLSAWNFRDELAAKLKAIGVPAGSRFYSYFPTPEIR